LLFLQRICSKCEHNTTESLGFRAPCSRNQQQKLCGKARKTPFTSAIGPDVENKQATFKRLFSNFSRRDPHPPASSLTMEGAVSLSGPSGVDAIGG
jgi:hypothetical protein